MSRFNRNYELQIETNDGEVIIITPPLTIEFNIARNYSATTNTMNLKVRNLSKNNREKIFQDWYDPKIYKAIVLKAGYDNLYTVFRGNIKRASSSRNGTDIITTIEAKDGGWDYDNSLIKKSYKAGISLKDLINDATGQLTYTKKGEFQIGDKTFRRPVVVDGDVMQIVRKYADAEVFIDLETLKILQDKSPLAGETLVIGSSSGLLRTPERQNTILDIYTIFLPEVVVGQLIQIKSDIQSDYDGTYKVLGITHTGMISEAVSGSIQTKLELEVNR